MDNSNPVKKAILGFNSALFCRCRSCPTYPGKNDPRVYCERGKSPLEIKRVSCLCPTCLVWKVNGFKETFYCDTGKDPKSRI
ncbi:hypothetical protein Dform_00330 [Dehalogenimonas formicexedens]|uniref:DUF2769 domain-containing protein n=1 Tax=Dehalogenimonas formicexedens TaxID=1839801 RepID=A0A1P8F5I3_9CHLR|nr:DUF2769 domain-containing protein [Dehalogenimonas formicexedens]APV43690.1 hypothetical protein Dform_00330 [Dehalogenimonas formicexedens]